MSEIDPKAVISEIKESLKPYVLTVSDEQVKSGLLSIFELSGFEKADGWKAALESLQSGRSCLAQFDRKDAELWFDIMAQFTARQGAIDLMVPVTLESVKIEFDPGHAHLALIISVEDFNHWFSAYPALPFYVKVVET